MTRHFLVVSLTFTFCVLPGGCTSIWKRNEDLGVVKQLDSGAPLKPHGLSDAEAAKACIATARELSSHGYTVDAIAEYEHARELNPRAKGIARHLAVLHDIQGNRTSAQREFKRALAESPKDADLLNDVGYFYMQQESWTEAEEFLRKALAADPKHQRARVNLGMVLGYEGRSDESLAIFKDAVGEAAAHANLGIVMTQMGRSEQAAEEFRIAMELDPNLKQPGIVLTFLEQRVAESGSN
jgi:Tfp pilus assembly protein PilF